jgi:copper(I)-binding protein
MSDVGSVQGVIGVEVGSRVWRAVRRGGTKGRSSMAAACVLTALASPATASDLSVSDAWVPASAAGEDIGLYMTVKNDAAEPDALVRTSCPFANFSERRTVDVGEGGLADRAIPNIPIPAHSTLTLTPKSYHVALLQTRDKLTAGESLSCRISFRTAGAMDVKVTVSQSAAKP